jgi:hypothetical protein
MIWASRIGMTDWICFVFAIVSLFGIILIGLKSPLSYLITYVLDFLANLRVFILTVYQYIPER